MIGPFALLMPVIFMGVGFAVDVGNSVSVRSKVASAADAAVIAGARALGEGKLTDAQVKELALKYFQSQEGSLQSTANAGTPVFTVDRETGRVSVQVNATVDMVFGQLVGMDTMSIPVKSTAEAAGKDIELSMVLDVTGSMAGPRLASLKTAATGVVDAILTGEKSATKKRIALVPFAAGVNAGLLASLVTGGLSLDCVNERGGRNRFTDASPLDVLNLLGRGRGLNCPSAKIQQLTTDAEGLKRQIGSFRANGGTAGHIGAAWGWYLLSPNWSTLLTGGKPEGYDTEKTIKAVIFMTDGEFNTHYVPQNGDSNTQARELCQGMKDSGIIVYTVAFEAPRSADQQLRSCASSTSHHYTAESGGELVSAFANIAKSLNKLRITE